MQKVLTAEEMRCVDRITTERFGIPSIDLMENAAKAVTREIERLLDGAVRGRSILVVCGKGNNGGDGAAAARMLLSMGARVETYLFGAVAESKGDAKTNFERLRQIVESSSGDPRSAIFAETSSDNWSLDFSSRKEKFDVIVDALFGTGLTRPLSSSYETTIDLISRERSKKPSLIVSVDLPSGLNADSANVIGKNVTSDVTVTFTAPKLANVLPPASRFNGELVVADIGSPQELVDEMKSDTFIFETADARNWMQQTSYTPDSYKKTRGNVLLIVGSKQYTGAAVLAGNGAIRSGAGIVTIITPKSAAESIAKRILPEVMVRGASETTEGALDENAFAEISKLGKGCDLMAIGCGLTSDNAGIKSLVRKLVESRKTPLVIDADGLNALSPFEISGADDLPLILTPHEGEFKRLAGMDDGDVITDRVTSVREFAVRWRVILVLKGERILIGGPDGRVVITPTGNSGLGKAGNGDNLTGIIAGFIAQAVRSQVDIFETGGAAVFTAGLSGDLAAERFGKRVMLASDVRDCLADAFKKIEGSYE